MSSHVTSNMHLPAAAESTEPLDLRHTFHEATPERAAYCVASVEDVSIFVQTPTQAQALADLFADVADSFGTDPVRTYVLRRAREAVAEFRAWLETPATGTEEDGAPRQYRYAEFAGRLATLVDELTDVPEAPTTEAAAE